MVVRQNQIELHTSGHRDMNDITADVQAIVSDSGVENGIAHVFNVGSTGVITHIEFEPGLRDDLPSILDKLIPSGTHYGHEQAWHDGNGHSHLQASIVGPGLTAPVQGGRLVLGTWQQIVHLECDVRPRDRRIMVTVIGE